MKAGDLVNHNPSCFDDPWHNGIIVESRDDPMRPRLSQHNVYWPNDGTRWTEEGFLELVNESR